VPAKNFTGTDSEAIFDNFSAAGLHHSRLSFGQIPSFTLLIMVIVILHF
jgi:hypothetical protein